ncbi:GHKL domain-containing protein [Listeria rocourtiae]|uniref:sensor histidine kinase n=1 Tax=Listeria rocourtiae TaxID=647910 RepID=UPI001629E36A|nr:GHKL domain-containing protein [Listeria rocourtiae]MBC1433815.1 GHKL domain-containing protein [Listeria rocourtiae]
MQALLFGLFLLIGCLLIGIQVLSRVRFQWKKLLILLTFLTLTALPLYVYLEFMSIPYIMLVLFIFMYRNTKNVKLSLMSIILSFAVGIISNLLTSLTLGNTFLDQEFSTAIFIFVYSCIIFKIIDVFLARIGSEVIFQGRYLALVLIVSAATVALFYFYIIRDARAELTEEALIVNAVIFLFYTFLMIIVLTIIVRSAVKNAKVEAQALQMSQLREYVGALEALQKDMRVFRHDYVNILSGINGFITNLDMDGLSVYFRTKVIPMNSDMEVNISKLSTLQNLEVIELKGLFATKMIRAQELGVDAQVEVYKRIDEMNMDSLDLCRVAGILLDNAIEAVVDTDDPTIRVAIIQKKEAIVLIFANSLPENSPPIHQFFEEGFSTKGDNRGIGLSTLKNTLKKYPNVSLDTKITQHGFVQELEIG